MPSKLPQYRHPGKGQAQTPGDSRQSAGRRGYGRKWREGLRVQTLIEEPFCRECLKVGRYELSVIADHIKPRRAGGPDIRANTQGLCRACSNRKLPDDLREIEEYNREGGS